jgi:hypothetical protein
MLLFLTLTACSPGSEATWSDRTDADAECPEPWRIHPQEANPLSMQPRFEYRLYDAEDPHITVTTEDEPIAGTQGWTTDEPFSYEWVPDAPLPRGEAIYVELTTCDSWVESFTTDTFGGPVEPARFEGVFSPVPLSRDEIEQPHPLMLEGTFADLLDETFAPLGRRGAPLVQLESADGEWVATIALTEVGIPYRQDLCSPTTTVPVDFDNPRLSFESPAWPLALDVPTPAPIGVYVQATAHERADRTRSLDAVRMQVSYPLPASATLCDPPGMECRECSAPGGCLDVVVDDWSLTLDANAAPLVPRTPDDIANDPLCAD